MLPHLSGSTIHVNYDGWTVITLEENSEDGDSLSCFMLHLPSMEKIVLPNLEDIKYKECFLSSSPLKLNCIVAFISRIDGEGEDRRSRIKLWRPNQEKWVEVVTKEWLRDFITCDGNIYRIYGWFGYFVRVDIHDNDVQVGNHINTPSLMLKGSIRGAEFLIESCGDVYLVMRLMLGVDKRVRTLQVYKLIQDKKTSEMDWIRMSDIDDRAFFIHNRLKSFSCSATQAGLKGNSIYFTGSGGDTHIYRYSLSENRFYRTLPCPDVAHDIRQICWLKIHQPAP